MLSLEPRGRYGLLASAAWSCCSARAFSSWSAVCNDRRAAVAAVATSPPSCPPSSSSSAFSFSSSSSAAPSASSSSTTSSSAALRPVTGPGRLAMRFLTSFCARIHASGGTPSPRSSSGITSNERYCGGGS